MVWFLGGVFSIIGTVFVVLSVGIGREIRFFIIWAVVLGFGRLLGDVIFYRLFRNDMEYAYLKLDSFDEVQARVEELLKEYHGTNPESPKNEQEE
jgi:hypothetical protein